MSDAKNAVEKLKKGLIRLSFSDVRSLYQAYMPFLIGCGVFYATDDIYPMGTDVFVFLELPEDMGKHAVAGRVVWSNPPKPHMKRVPGIGIQLRGKNVEKIKEIIENKLASQLKAGLPTATL